MNDDFILSLEDRCRLLDFKIGDVIELFENLHSDLYDLDVYDFFDNYYFRILSLHRDIIHHYPKPNLSTNSISEQYRIREKFGLL